MPEDDTLGPADQRRAVRERYGRLATESSCRDDACCDSPPERAEDLGYSAADLDAGAAADLSLGCGNPAALADLETGDAVLDLGSGAGFDCFLASREVGPDGRVVGVDMTPEMVERARENARDHDAANVEFRLGEIEHLPVADASVDVILSNCVVNLSPDKQQVFREARRVLRPGGRLAVSDVVLTADLPADLRADPTSVAACVGGAATVPALETMLDAAGFLDVTVEPTEDGASFIEEWDSERDLSDYVATATIEGVAPPA